MGAYVGTLICPGVGTIIGAGIGIFGGAIIGNSLFEWGKERIKWRKIIDEQDHFGEKFKTGMNYGFCSKVVDKFLETHKLKNELNKEKKLYEKYKDELNSYKSMEPSVSAVLTEEYYNSLKTTERRINHTKSIIKERILAVCASNVRNLEEARREKFSRRLIGELVIGNVDCFGSMSQEEINLLKGYRTQKTKSPNYPYQFSDTPEQVNGKDC